MLPKNENNTKLPYFILIELLALGVNLTLYLRNALNINYAKYSKVNGAIIINTGFHT